KGLYRNPGPKALSFGLLEVGYLRLAGHDVEAAAAARRLLTTLHRTESKRSIHPVLSSVVNLHAGVALMIGGDPVAASSSCRAARGHPRSTRVDRRTRQVDRGRRVGTGDDRPRRPPGTGECRAVGARPRGSGRGAARPAGHTGPGRDVAGPHLPPRYEERAGW